MHIKTNRRYYADVGEKILKSKKLKMRDWLSSMLYNDLPVDELCMHARSTYLNIHITIDYHHRFWSMLDIPNTNHDLVTLVSDIHLVYRGYCRFNLLCKHSELGTKVRSLLLHKISDENIQINLPEVKIKLRRVEEWNSLAKKLLKNKTITV